MSNLQIICELCEITELLVEVVSSQAEALAQLGAETETDKRDSALGRYRALLGADETPE